MSINEKIKKKIFYFDKEFSLFSILTFLSFLLSEIIEIYRTNSVYFLESISRYSNLFFIFSIIILIYFFYKKSLILFYIIILFYTNILFLFKSSTYKLVEYYFQGDEYILIFIIVLIFYVLLISLMYFISVKYMKFLSLTLLICYTISAISSLLFSQQVVIPKVTPFYKIRSINKNIYVLLFDEYPSYEVFKNNYKIDSNFHIHTSIKNKGFTQLQGVYSNYIYTDKSISSILSGRLNDSASINTVINLLENNVFTQGDNYKFFKFSIFEESNRKNSLVTTRFFRGINTVVSRYIAPYIISLFSIRGIGNFTDYEAYHDDVLSGIEDVVSLKGKKVVFAHFFTPHYYPLVYSQRISERLKNANLWIDKTISIIMKSDKDAGIIILSDHGLRMKEIPRHLANRNILYYKNIKIDTQKLKSYGIYRLFESIDY